MMTRKAGVRPSLAWAVAMTLGAAGLLAPAIVNGFPLIFPDSVDNMMLTPRVYRSSFYQLWVFGTGLKLSPWPTIVAQALVVSWLVCTFMAVEARATAARAVVALLVLCTFSSLPICTSFVMPDVFTGVMFLCVYLLVFRWHRLSSWRRVALLGLATVAVAVHLSHLIMAVGMITASVAYVLARHGRGVARGGMLGAVVACACAAGAAVAYNSVVFHRPALSPAGPTFLMAKLIAQGPARAELQATCPGAAYRLCAYVDRLPESADALLWGDGIIVHLGGFDAMGEESSRLVSATLVHRPWRVLVAALASTGAALGTVDSTAEILPSESFVRERMGLVDGTDVQFRYLHAAQELGRFPRRSVTLLTLAGLIGAGFVIVVAVWRRRDGGVGFAGYALAAFVVNAGVCATLSGVHDRYRCRVSWLMVLAALALVLGRRRPDGYVGARSERGEWREAMA